MNIAIFSTATGYSGGAIISLMNVLPILKEKNVKPFFILKGHGSLEQILKEENINYVVIRSYDWCLPKKKTKGVKNKVAWFIKSILNIIAEIRIFFYLKNVNIDIYHLNCIYNGTGVIAAKLLHIPVLWHLREFVDIDGETTMFMNSDKAWKKINLSDIIISVSDYLCEFYKGKIIDNSKIRIVYDGINMNLFKPKKESFFRNNRIIIGLVGTAEIKNHKDILLALSLLKKTGLDNFTLKIAGAWSNDDYNQKYLNTLKILIAENDLSENVLFVGMQRDMNEFWHSCDLSVVCSKRESFGLSATEAMACRIPLICSDTSISGELTNNGKNVFVYKTGDVNSLCDQVRLCLALISTGNLNSKLDDACNHIRSNFSLEKSAISLYGVYNEAYRIRHLSN